MWLIQNPLLFLKSQPSQLSTTTARERRRCSTPRMHPKQPDIRLLSSTLSNTWRSITQFPRAIDTNWTLPLSIVIAITPSVPPISTVLFFNFTIPHFHSTLSSPIAPSFSPFDRDYTLSLCTFIRFSAMAGWRGSRGGGDAASSEDRIASSQTVRLGKVQPQALGHRTIFCNDRDANLHTKFKVSFFIGFFLSFLCVWFGKNKNAILGLRHCQFQGVCERAGYVIFWGI